jgi:DNA-binding MarR family transcriptional regulator
VSPPPDKAELELMADEMFELTKLGMISRTAPRKKGGIDLTESEFLTLDFLCKENSLTVGELQRRIRVLPAQMSRVIRSLESKSDKPLIKCRINPQDKRRIDVSVTEQGVKARQRYRDARMASALKVLSQLDAGDRHEFSRILEKIRVIMSEAVK